MCVKVHTFQTMKFFLSLDKNGRQKFSVEGGDCSNLQTGAQVFTHHQSFVSKYTMDPTVVVQVERLPIDSILSGPAISKMTYPEGDNLIRAELGWLDEEVAPVEVELAMVIAFKNSKIRAHSFLVGGKKKNFTVQLTKLGGGLCKDIDVTKKYTLGVDFTTVQFPSMKKVTDWKKLEEMFKDSFSGCTDLANENVYARWRILEYKKDCAKEGISLSLCLELLPLSDLLKNHDMERIALYNSSSNMAICLLEIPLKWRSPDEKKGLFTSPCLVTDSRECLVSDSMVLLGMATVRDALRRGRLSKNIDEHKSTVSDPVVFPIWEKCRRKLFMAEADTFEVTEIGKSITLLSVFRVKLS